MTNKCKHLFFCNSCGSQMSPLPGVFNACTCDKCEIKLEDYILQLEQSLEKANEDNKLLTFKDKKELLTNNYDLYIRINMLDIDENVSALEKVIGTKYLRQELECIVETILHSRKRS